MSKFKNGDKVIVKESGKIGIVKGREINTLPDGKVNVEYIVKLDDGFWNWKCYHRNELTKVVTEKPKKKANVKIFDAPNGWKVTLVSIVNRQKVWRDAFDENGFYAPYERDGKEFSIGYSIYNPNDEWNEDLGVRIATHRAKKKPFCHLVGDFSGEFTKETIEALMNVKGEYIVNHIDEFVNK